MAQGKENTHYVLWCVSRLGGELYILNDCLYERLAKYVAGPMEGGLTSWSNFSKNQFTKLLGPSLGVN